MSAVLEAREVNKSFGNAGVTTPVLHDISLCIEAGEFVAITGHSGSGKTTLLYLLGALDRPTHGHILVDGADTSQMSEAALTQLRQNKIGFVFQFHFLLPEFSALDNVAIPAMLAGMRPEQAQAQAKALLEQVGLGHRLGHRPGQLSGGEQQRVSIARALVNQPRLMLADEPTGNLDSDNTEKVFALLQQLNRDTGLAVVFVTHNLELAERCQRTIALRDGRVVSV
jgi:lipoprotein releasing system ATP-binding protein